MTLELFIYVLFVSPLLSVNLDYYYDFQYPNVVSDEVLDFDDDEDMSPNSTLSNPEQTPNHTLPSVTGDFKKSFIPFWFNRLFQMVFFLRQNDLERSFLHPPWGKK